MNQKEYIDNTLDICNSILVSLTEQQTALHKFIQERIEQANKEVNDEQKV